MQAALPIDRYVLEITNCVRSERSAVIVAPPGSGKTTRIPPALTEIGRTILLQPRRVAARALTRRIAVERGWTIGEEIGWQIRFERRFGANTRLLVATEGILTARLQSDPLLSDFRVVILDEFHERSIHGDLALALVRQAAQARDDLAVVVMSATIDAAPVAQFLGAPVIEVGAPNFPVEVRYRPALSPAAAVREVLASAHGDVLCFLPGVREIERTRDELSSSDALVLPLHGTLDVDAQERAIAPSDRRRVILATNIAETSLTVEGVTDVIDSGLQKVLRYDAETGVDHLETEQIPRDSADQRAGRAGRTSPGRATRLWDERAILRTHREPEVHRVDLAGPALDILAWGGHPSTFAWFEPPPRDRLDAALSLLELLGAMKDGRLTEIGQQLRRFPLHPRLARVAVAAHGADLAMAICTLLSEDGRRLTRRPEPPTTSSDPISMAESFYRTPSATLRELTAIARRILGDDYRADADEETILRALLAGYPDRVAMRRERGSPRLLLASGTGAQLARESGVRGGEFVVAVEITGSGGEPLVRMASLVEREWLEPTRREREHFVEGGRVRAVERVYYDRLLLREQPMAPDAGAAAMIIAREALAAVDPELLLRLAFARIDVNWNELAERAAAGQTRVADADVAALLPFEVKRRLDQLAPQRLPLPEGRSAKLEYREDGTVLASVKLQHVFGLAETPRLGPDRKPVTFALLAPNGRPVQITQDLGSFWRTTYAEVRKELRGRYPKHHWPEKPA